MAPLYAADHVDTAMRPVASIHRKIRGPNLSAEEYAGPDSVLV